MSRGEGSKVGHGNHADTGGVRRRCALERAAGPPRCPSERAHASAAPPTRSESSMNTRASIAPPVVCPPSWRQSLGLTSMAYLASARPRIVSMNHRRTNQTGNGANEHSDCLASPAMHVIQVEIPDAQDAVGACGQPTWRSPLKAQLGHTIRLSDAPRWPRDAQTAAVGKASCLELYDEILSAACRDQRPGAPSQNRPMT